MRRSHGSGLEVDILLIPLISGAECARGIQTVYAVLKHDALTVPFAHALRLDAVIAGWPLLSTLYTALPTS
jgi:hypothetical protein